MKLYRCVALIKFKAGNIMIITRVKVQIYFVSVVFVGQPILQYSVSVFGKFMVDTLFTWKKKKKPKYLTKQW